MLMKTALCHVCHVSLLSPGDIIAELLGEGEHLLALVPGLSLNPDLTQPLDGLAVEIIMLKTGDISRDLFFRLSDTWHFTFDIK